MSNKSKIRPLGNRVLIQRTKAETTKGGILLPDSAQEKPRKGTVIATGPGKTDDEGRLIPMNVRTGDIVMFTSYAGTEVGADQEYILMTEDDLLGIVEN